VAQVVKCLPSNCSIPTTAKKKKKVVGNDAIISTICVIYILYIIYNGKVLRTYVRILSKI
jgi:hypothetical protein